MWTFFVSKLLVYEVCESEWRDEASRVHQGQHVESGRAASARRAGRRRVQTRDVFADVDSGTRAAIERPGMKKLLEYADEGDTVVVWPVDRLGRSFIDVLNTVNTLRDRGILVRSLSTGLIRRRRPGG